MKGLLLLPVFFVIGVLAAEQQVNVNTEGTNINDLYIEAPKYVPQPLTWRPPQVHAPKPTWQVKEENDD